jgi:anhydro-N-acetylmuramic acid kinase
MTEYFIGLMSGTSADGIDAALVDFSKKRPQLIATHYTPHPEPIRQKIFALTQKGDNELSRMCELDVLLGHAFADNVNTLLQQSGISSKKIKAIGSHGQTLRHYPKQGYTLQIGDPNIIAAKTQITTIADFRRRDIAHGGQGAPLVPAFHQALFASTRVNRAIVNIGGIANITVLSKRKTVPLVGYDTGPGNGLLDAWIHLHRKVTHDVRGEWGAQGIMQKDLLDSMLRDSYFQQTPPKSTGREHFNLLWIKEHLHKVNRVIAAIDVQATLVELTAFTILQAIRQHINEGEILICGGGAHNLYLMTRLQLLAKPHFSINTTDIFGIAPDWIEAVAFAWLAKQTLTKKPGNSISVTGAAKEVILGGVYYK